ncbi:MAG: hypothetical protein GY786_22140 [Proteobacteria bacterium]|nr:hypothetical protein [Pseudomonadota bacterium]
MKSSTNIELFADKLSRQKHGENYYNPYRYKHLCQNLIKYLNLLYGYQKNPLLLVGEAPGYKGCKLTGIPFSSGAIFQEVNHPFLKLLASDLVIKKTESENTATMVWNYLAKQNITPLFWNAFPFHPFPQGSPDKNRAPTKIEISDGSVFLKDLSQIFKPHLIAGIGRAGQQAAQIVFPEKSIPYIRHPSFGGKNDFISQMNELTKSG